MIMTNAIHSTIYADLFASFLPRPIRSEEDLQATQVVIDRLLDQGQLSKEQKDYLNILGMLVEDYETAHCPIPDLSGIELLKELIADRSLKQKDLVPIFKTESIVSAVLSGQRHLTVEHIEKLADFFHVSPATFFKKTIAVSR
jgi:HTH-type transcriptional regulator / antitoxin HigA